MFYQTALRISDIDQALWMDRVERSYQLDEASQVLCQSIFNWNSQGLKFDETQAIIYLFDRGSNKADQDFIQSQGLSPAKFVYTLPNIPITIVQQMLKISVPTYCLTANDLDRLDENQQVKELMEALVSKYEKILVIRLKAPSATAPDLWTISALVSPLLERVVQL